MYYRTIYTDGAARFRNSTLWGIHSEQLMWCKGRHLDIHVSNECNDVETHISTPEFASLKLSSPRNAKTSVSGQPLRNAHIFGIQDRAWWLVLARLNHDVEQLGCCLPLNAWWPPQLPMIKADLRLSLLDPPAEPVVNFLSLGKLLCPGWPIGI